MASYLDVDYEFENDPEFESESDETGLAAELLEVSNDEELEYFLGDLISNVSKTAGGFIKSSTGRALTKILKSAAKKALPVIGGSIGQRLGGDRWGKFGRTVGNATGRALGLELEGLSGEDQEFETAKQFIRFAKSAVHNAAMTNQKLHPATVAAKAVNSAARRYAPGLVRNFGHRRSVTSGRWVRKGNHIVVLSV